MTQQEYLRNLDAFYKHPFIRNLSNVSKWTISDNNKMPIDFKILMYKHKVIGALSQNQDSLATLMEIHNTIPQPANHAYWLDVFEDHFIVLDIEPKCPPQIRNELLKLPYIYGEISMSGKGHHLIFPEPDWLRNYPNAINKTVIKEPNGYYEFLLNHYVTFTHRIIPPPSGTKDLKSYLEPLCVQQKENVDTSVFVQNEHPKDVPYYDDILGNLQNLKYKKTPADFADEYGNPDMSRYEYAFMGYIYSFIQQIITIDYIKKAHTYTDNEKAWLIYDTAVYSLPYRAKHDTYRCGLPWLLWCASRLIAKHISKQGGSHVT